MLTLLLALGCGGEPEVERSPAQLADEAARELWRAPSQPEATPSSTGQPVAPQAAAPPQTTAAPGEAAPLPTLTLSYEGINSLYKGFFADPALQGPLAAALAPSVQGPLDLDLGYDQVAVRGHIRLRVPPGGLRVPVRVEGDRVALQDLAPITAALDAYRLGLGARYDLRLLNFRVGVELRGGGRTCFFEPAGDPPPDGSVVSPCVTVGGAKECGQPAREGVLFAPPVASALRACLGR